MTSKSDALYAHLRADILSLKLEPGCALRLPVLSKRYDVGVTPLRECLNRLGAERLVIIEHNRGFRVAPLSLDDLLDLETSRCAVEGALFAQSVQRGDDEWEKRVLGAYHHLAALPAASVLQTEEDVAIWTKRHNAFHAALISGVGAPWMHHFQMQIGDNLGRYQLHIQRSLREHCTSCPDPGTDAVAIYATAMALDPHDVLFEVAMARDPVSAQALFEDHVRLSVEAFLSLQDIIRLGDGSSMGGFFNFEGARG